jgi:REP element-mobilizing transposase RayT
MRLVAIEPPQRRSVRLPGYDYTSPGAYFITIVTRDRQVLFGEVSLGEMHLNPYGQIVLEEWLRSGEIRSELEVEASVVMPNHLHGILVLSNVKARGTVPLRQSFAKPVSGSIPTIIRSFKAASAKRINEARGTPGLAVWQRNYHEHVVRDEKDLDRIYQYILNNPLQWELDEENPVK